MTSYTLSLFEEYMFLDDTSSYPMEPTTTLIFKGLLEPNACRDAFEQTVDRHFLLRATVSRRGRKLRWQESAARPELITLDSDANAEALDATGAPIFAKLDITVEPGLRVYCLYNARENWTRLYFHFHHSVADGLGMSLVMSDWLLFYGRLVGALPLTVPGRVYSADRFAQRGAVGWTFVEYLKYYFHTWRTTLQHIAVYPRPLVSERARRTSEAARSGSLTRSFTLTRAETSACVRRAKAVGATVNDVLLTDFLRANERWLTEVRRDARGGKLRVMIPINMRTPETATLPCCDVVSTVFLDRRRRALRRSRAEVLTGVAREMNWVKKREQKRVFLLILRVLQYFPGALRFFLRAPTCRASTVFSNLGRLLDDFDAPRDERGKIVLRDVTLEGISGQSPIRRKTTTACVTNTYAGEMNFTLCYDSGLITDAEAQEFIRIFREETLG